MPDNFTWIPFFEALSRELLKWRDRQDELIEFLESLRSSGMTITPFLDRDPQGHRMPLEEIDPFTFMGVINRRIAEDTRFGIAAAMKYHFGLEVPIPSDFDGIPTLVPMSSWFFAFKPDRGTEDVANLWRLLELALQPDPLSNEDFLETFDQVLKQPRVNINITMGLFWARPAEFISLDRHMRSFLNIALPSKGLTAEFYRNTVKRILQSGRTPVSVSHDAWLAGTRQPVTKVPSVDGPPSVSYWIVGANWEGVDPPDQTSRFLEEGIWEAPEGDQYSELIRSMNVGDRIAIRTRANQKHDLPFDANGRTISRMTIHAIGTVVKNSGDGRRVEVEWVPEHEPRDWYFYTYVPNVWKLQTDPNHRFIEYSRRLIDFVWNGAEQDYEFWLDQWFGPRIYLPDGDLLDPYGSEDVIADGAFMDLAEVEEILGRLRAKKALILQGPPGVGKTYLARRFAFALMEEREPERLRMVQFHQSYAYEDFMRGYRPQPDRAGAFALLDGIFFEFCERARQDPEHAYVFIIDEINRGNLSQIFGEALMLIEADKRTPEYALPLVYRYEDEDDFYVPSNVHLIGLMNVADRSLAMIDYALRRRFAFLDLEPRFQHPSFDRWLRDRGMAPELISLIVNRLSDLNDTIEADQLLGRNYRVGHSFFTPKGEDFSKLDERWYRGIVSSEIGPLLHEYWYDNLAAAENAIEALLTP